MSAPLVSSAARSLALDRFEAVSRASPVGIFHANLDGRVTYVNPRLQAIFAASAPDLLDFRWVAHVFPADRDALRRGWAGANADAREYDHEFRVVLPDGDLHWIHGRSAIVNDAAGAPIQIVGTVEDVTARHTAIERTRGLLAISSALASALTGDAVARAVAEYAAPVVGAGSTMVAVLAPDGDALRLVGDEELSDVVRATYGRLGLAQATPLTDVMRHGRPVLLTSPVAMAESYPDAAPLWAAIGARALSVFPLVADGRRFGVIAFRFPAARAFDEDDLDFLRAVVQQCAVSLERARLYDEAREAREEADDANRAKGEFLARMSHELRTPLNAIAGHLQLVEMGLHGPVTPAQQEALGRVNRAQRHLLGLINDVLNLARLESRRVEYTLTPVRVSTVVADVRPMVEPQLAAKGIRFVVRSPEDGGAPPVLVWADREKLVQVLLNLLANAIKFTNEGGEVALELSADGGSPDDATIVVRDTGIGIPLDRIAEIFEPFVQIQTTYTRAYQGTGLGLAISRDLARGMGGELTAESGAGGGSAFTLRLRRAVTTEGARTDRRDRVQRRVGLERRSGGDRRHVG